MKTKTDQKHIMQLAMQMLLLTFLNLNNRRIVIAFYAQKILLLVECEN